MVKEIQADVFDAPIDTLVHCANCFHTMGSGIAKALRDAYPEVYEADISQTTKGDRSKLGTFSLAEIRNPSSRKNPRLKFVYNLYGQYTYGREKRQVDYEAVYRGLESIAEDIMIEAGGKEVLGINYKMCCNLAVGDWNIILAMIHSVFDSAPFVVLICRRPGD